MRDAGDLKGLRLLMVDDQQVILDTVTPLLDSWGLTVRTTIDPEEALRLLLTEDFDLLITDLVTPRLDGITLLNRLIDASRFIPTLVLSGSQGNRQAAALLHDLSNDRLRELGLPLLYMKKEPEGFAEGVRDRLVYLSGRPRFDARGVTEHALPALRSVLSEEASSAQIRWTRDGELKRFLARFVDILLDQQFSMLLNAAPHLQEIERHAAAFPAGPFKASLELILKTWREPPQRDRIEILQLDATGWHDYRNKLKSYCLRPETTLYIIENQKMKIPEQLQRALQILQREANVLDEIAAKICEIVFTIESRIETRVADSLGLHANRFQGGASIGIDPNLVLRLPGWMLQHIPLQLFKNAEEATPPGRSAPSLAVNVVPATDPHGIERRSVSITVTNHGDPIPEEIRRRMIAGERFTTKRFHAGMGLVLVHAYLRAVGGWLEVRSLEGRNKVTVYIPLSGNQARREG